MKNFESIDIFAELTKVIAQKLVGKEVCIHKHTPKNNNPRWFASSSVKDDCIWVHIEDVEITTEGYYEEKEAAVTLKVQIEGKKAEVYITQFEMMLIR